MDYFIEERNWSQGLSWFEEQFNTTDPIIRLFGEASTNHSKYPTLAGVSQKIASSLPDVKIIYLERDPIERIRSMYVHNIHKGNEKRSFDEVIINLDDNHYIAVSLYFSQFEQYLKYFPSRQINIVVSEELRNERIETLNQIFEFLGVKPVQSPQFWKIIHRSAKKT